MRRTACQGTDIDIIESLRSANALPVQMAGVLGDALDRVARSETSEKNITLQRLINFATVLVPILPPATIALVSHFTTTQ